MSQGLGALWLYRWLAPSMALNSYVLIETNAPVWQYIAIPGCVIFAAWIGVRTAECWKAGQWGSATGASLLFILTVLANIYVAITAAALTHDAAIGSRSAKIEKSTGVAEAIKETKAELTTKRSETSMKTEGQIQAAIAQLESSPIFRDEKRSNRCANDSVSESQKLCEQWRGEKGRLAAAQRIVVLEERLGKLQEKSWGGTAETESVTDADPGAKAMATITGLSEKFITAGFTGYIAVLLELIAAFAPAFCGGAPVVREIGGDRTLTPGPAVEPVVPAVAEIPSPATIPAVVRLSPAVADVSNLESVRAWWEAQIIHRQGTNIQANALYAVYVKWCSDQGITPVKMRSWGDYMKKQLKMSTFVDSGRRTHYTNIAVRPALKVVAN